ncbi:type II toxin-antitoxin system HicB family antitoxin [Companilactobacillus mishanensis]|uniref:type II toxin-antitoxin system HicB family antitoxin n=1 Tax=Companilactobacillus mishanensis TaxID=2486008 RepID=UPI001297ADE0|nr:type II toxin-antitoxin system HicB family antitoxin [Companilactobacillus mishanensis]MQS89765.1 hypothetical protein [Companilactobacillus mishanensis]
MINKITYPAVVAQSVLDDQIMYNVSFPDLSSAITYGTNLREALLNARTLLKLLLDGEEVLPESSTMTEVQAHYPKCMVSLVTAEWNKE